MLSFAAVKRVLVWFSTVAALAAQPLIQTQIFNPSSNGSTKALAADTSGNVFAGGQSGSIGFVSKFDSGFHQLFYATIAGDIAQTNAPSTMEAIRCYSAAMMFAWAAGLVLPISPAAALPEEGPAWPPRWCGLRGLMATRCRVPRVRARRRRASLRLAGTNAAWPAWKPALRAL